MTSRGCRPRRKKWTAFLAGHFAKALEKVVDRLLASPRYGEHWGRHWLDVVRYADTGRRCIGLLRFRRCTGIAIT